MTGTISHLQMSDPNVLAFEFSGIVTHHNIQTVVDTIAPLVRGPGRLSLVLIFCGAAGHQENLKFDATIVAESLNGDSNLEKVAIAGHRLYTDRVLAALGPILPIDIRTFTDDQTDELWTYVQSHPIPVGSVARQ